MPADAPTILATSGGMRRGRRTNVEFGPLVLHAIELSGVSGRAPRLCHVGTAGGDQSWFQAWLGDAGRAQGITVSHLNLFSMPNTGDMTGLLLDQDVAWVGGGSVANLLALWRLHGLDEIFRKAWQAGVVLSGVSAGSVCWHTGGTTDSFGPDLRPVTNGLGFLPYSNGVHYDSEPQRRPKYQRFISEGILPGGYATDDGVGLVYRGTEFAEAVTEVRGKGAYMVTSTGGAVQEERIEPRLLPEPRPGGAWPRAAHDRGEP
jgi:peptidase E